MSTPKEGNIIKITDALTLVPLGLDFLDSVHSYASDIENTRYMMRLPNESLDETRAFLETVDAEWQKESLSFYEFAILLDGVHIGAVSAYLDEMETGTCAELGWIIRKEYWGRGLGYEAAKAMVAFCRERLGVHHFIAHCDTENVGSRRIMEKLGMKCICINEGRRNRAATEDSREYQYELIVIDFSTITACGECCMGCKKKESGLCKGCIESDGHCEEWTQSKGCPIYKCAREHEVQFCGLCKEFPCEWLLQKVTWRANMVEELIELADLYHKQKGE